MEKGSSRIVVVVDDNVDVEPVENLPKTKSCRRLSLEELIGHVSSVP